MKWLTTTEAAELTGYHVRYLRQLVNEGKVYAVKRGGIFWIDKKSVIVYADSTFPTTFLHNGQENHA